AAAHELARTAGSGFPVAVATIATPSPAIDVLGSHGVPVYRDAEAAVAALTRLSAAVVAPRGVPDPPFPAPPVEAADYEAARALLAAGGVPFVEARFVMTVDEALAGAAEIG